MVSSNQNVVSINLRGKADGCGRALHEIVSCPASPSVSLPWSKSMRLELDR